MPSVAAEDWTLLLRAAPSRVARVRLLMWLTPLVPLVTAQVLWWHSHDEAAFAADFGAGMTAVFGPLAIVALAALLPAGAWLLHGRYVTVIEAHLPTRRLRVTILTARGSRCLEGDIRAFTDGGVHVGGSGTVYTPTAGLHAPDGRRLLIDLQGAEWTEAAAAAWRQLQR